MSEETACVVLGSVVALLTGPGGSSLKLEKPATNPRCSSSTYPIMVEFQIQRGFKFDFMPFV